MSIVVRPYEHPADYARIDRFLIDTYRPGETFSNWLQPRWEYMHHHPFILGKPLDSCGVAEDGGEIVGIVHFEHTPAFLYLQAHPDRDDAKLALMEHAVACLGGHSKTFGRKILGVFIHESDTALQEIAADHGLVMEADHAEEHSRLDLSTPLQSAPIPAGFTIQSLADENDLRKVNAVLWRGFGHPDPPPADEVIGRVFAQSAPNYRKDLTIVAVALDGQYVSFSGMWVVPDNRVAYVEPVATDPDFRRAGLGKAVVLEAVRRAAAEGSDVAWVGSGQEFYRAIGFRTVFKSDLWIKYLD